MSILWRSSLLRLAQGCANCFDHVILFAGPGFVILATVLISACVYLYFTALLPYLMTSSPLAPLAGPLFSAGGAAAAAAAAGEGDVTAGGFRYSAGLLLSPFFVVNMAVAFWLLFNIFFNYFACITTPPGHAKVWKPEDGPAPPNTKICKKCNAAKPERAHHCTVCNACVYRMDHHCVWMHNCVGHQNHRYFFLFLFYLWLGCLYYCLVACFPFWESANMSPRKWNALHPEMTKNILSFAFVIAVAIWCSVSPLMIWTFYLILSAQTTIEFYTNRLYARDHKLRGEVFANVYDLGTIKNLKFFFNVSPQYPWWTMLLPMRVPGQGDGTSYPSLRARATQV